MYLKNKNLQFWYILPNSKELRKFEIDLLPIMVFVSLFVIFMCGFFVIGFFLSSNALSQTKKHFAYMLEDVKVKNLKDEKEFLKRKNTFLENEMARILDANKKYTEYEINISKRNKELADLIENTTKIDMVNGGIISGQNNSIGGLELRPYENEKDFINRSINIDKFDDIKRQALIKQMDKLNKTVATIPIGLPLKSSIVSSNFGIRRSPFTGKIVKHLGVDFASPYGAMVRATGKGIVTKARYSDTYGYMIDIRHKRHLITRYAHLSKILVEEGAMVNRGDLIGLVGSTGLSTGNHLHYEVKVNKKSVNPMAFIHLATYLSNTANSISTARR